MNAIKLSNLRSFVAIYEEGSISGAARRLNATQSGISVQLRDLENNLGVALFDRQHSGVLPTQLAERIYRRAIKVLNEVNQLGDDIQGAKDVVTGEVRAGIMPTMARAIFGPVVVEFSRKHPLVDVRVTEGYSGFLTDMVRAGELDFAVVPDGDLPVGVQSTLLDTDLEILASYRPLAKAGEAIDLSKINPLRLVLPGPRNARRAKIDRALRNAASGKVSVMELDSMMATLDIIQRGDFCSILPGCLCLPDIGSSDVHLYPITKPPMTLDYLLIEPAVKDDSAAIRRFVDDLSLEIRRACRSCREHFGLA